MIDVGFSTTFKKAYKKLIKSNPIIKEKFAEKLDIFFYNPFSNQLKTHKLTGKLNNLWSFSVDYSVRVVFYFENNDKVTLIDIGSHDDVY